MEAPRSSNETDRRALLQSTSTSAAPSMRTASIYTDLDGERTPRAGSPVPSFRSHATSTTPASRHSSIATESPRPYKGFPSEEAYLNALRAWVEEKKYIQPTEETTMLQGWYGTKTMDDYIQQSGPAPEMSSFRRWRERKAEKKEEKKRRASAAA